MRTAENADEAIRRLAEEKPDLILMDVVMPGQNGFPADARHQPRPVTDVPIIMCTSKNQETDRVWGMRQGARLHRQAGGSCRTASQDRRLN